MPHALSDLPVEILDRIFSYMTSQSILTSLMRCSRLLNTVAAPYFYKSLRLQCISFENTYEGQATLVNVWLHLHRLINLFRERPILAANVEQLTICSFMHDRPTSAAQLQPVSHHHFTIDSGDEDEGLDMLEYAFGWRVPPRPESDHDGYLTPLLRLTRNVRSIILRLDPLDKGGVIWNVSQAQAGLLDPLQLKHLDVSGQASPGQGQKRSNTLAAYQAFELASHFPGLQSFSMYNTRLDSGIRELPDSVKRVKVHHCWSQEDHDELFTQSPTLITAVVVTPSNCPYGVDGYEMADMEHLKYTLESNESSLENLQITQQPLARGCTPFELASFVNIQAFEKLQRLYIDAVWIPKMEWDPPKEPEELDLEPGDSFDDDDDFWPDCEGLVYYRDEDLMDAVLPAFLRELVIECIEPSSKEIRPNALMTLFDTAYDRFDELEVVIVRASDTLYSKDGTGWALAVAMGTKHQIGCLLLSVVSTGETTIRATNLDGPQSEYARSYKWEEGHWNPQDWRSWKIFNM